MKRLTILFGAAFAMCIAAYAFAVTVNPTSNVLGDSANTASTLVYRDSSGNFAAGTITATVTAVSDGAIVTAKIAANAVTTAKMGFAITALETAKILCGKNDGTIGYCGYAAWNVAGTCECN